MDALPASSRTSTISTNTAHGTRQYSSFSSTLPLASLYVVSGLPKSPHTWTLADSDSVSGLQHSEGAVTRWWRPEVLGSTVSPGTRVGGKKSKNNRSDTDLLKGIGTHSKQDIGKMLSKALKLSFTREVEIIASTLQPASTVHTFTFMLTPPSTPLAPTSPEDLIRSTGITATEFCLIQHLDDPLAHLRPSTSPVGLSSSLTGVPQAAASTQPDNISNHGVAGGTNNGINYHGVCLTVWSHADTERTVAIRRALETGRPRRESMQSHVPSRLRMLRPDVRAPKISFSAATASINDPISGMRASRSSKTVKSLWTDGETDIESAGDGAVSESDFEGASSMGHGPGESTLFVPGDTVFWLPYALTLVSRHPIYDLMRDYLTLSWARFSKDVHAHTLQISKILSHPAPRPGDLVKLDASASGDINLEIIARFPGGLDFGRGLVDINFTMWPLFKCLDIDHILTICEIALSPTGRILFFSRHPAMLGIAVSTIKYLVELRGWSGIALAAVHSRDIKIYVDDPGPWIIGLATEARYTVKPGPDICVCDLDMNYLSCTSPPKGILSVKQQRDRYRQKLLAAFEPRYHPDHSVASEFKEGFPAGRFRPLCKIQAKRGSEMTAIADTIKPPEWWHSTRVIQAFDAVLQDKSKRPSLLKRISSFGVVRRPPRLTVAEQLIQHSIRKRATAFVDARDDLETKIGRLSRRLNFLVSESDLWRDKFVTFEHYAEKLSVEASDLRTRINREQKETKRLSGLVNVTNVEKVKLQNQLRDTESAHKEALQELEKMKATMERMEHERAEMVAEVEAQIERALASMAVESDESNCDIDSRPTSRLSSISVIDFKRRHALIEPVIVDHLTDNGGNYDSVSRQPNRAVAMREKDYTSIARTKRFSATHSELVHDGMAAVDRGISEQSDRIAQKVKQIQQKLESALTFDGYVVGSGKEDIRGEPPNLGLRAVYASEVCSEGYTSISNAAVRHSCDTIQPTPEPNGSSCAYDLTGAQSMSSLLGVHNSMAPRVRAATMSRGSKHLPSSGPDYSDCEFRSAYSSSPRGSQSD